MRNWIKNLVRPLVSSVVRSSNESPAVAKPVVMTAELLEDRRLCSSSLVYGLGVNKISSGSYNSVVRTLKATGTHAVRMWLTVNSYGTRSDQGIFKYIKKMHAAGFEVLLTVSPKNGLNGSTTAVKSYFTWLDGKLGGSVDIWEVGNEVDKTRQFSGHLTKYVSDLLRPAYLALHSHGEKVSSSSVSWNPADIATMVKGGMLSYCDYVGYHPYRSSVKDLKASVAAVKALAGGKPLVASEWNVRGLEGDKGAWADEISQFWPTIRDNFYAAYYYAATKTGTMAGAAAVMTSNGSKNGAFYSAYADLPDTGGSGSLPTPPSGTTTAPSAPSDPVSSPADSSSTSSGNPVITGFRIFDAVTGEVIKGYENVLGTTTLDLSKLDDRQIQIRALVDGNVSSVKVNFTDRGSRVENLAPFTVFANKSGKAAGWTTLKGKFTLTATAYAKDGAKGTASKTVSLVLKLV